MPPNLENSAVAIELEKISFHSNPKERQCQRMFRLLYNATISHVSKVMLKILQARLQQYVNQDFQMYKLDLEKAEEPEIKLPTSIDHRESKGIPEKKYFCFIDYTKAFDCVDHNKLWKILQVMGIPDHLSGLLLTLYACQEAIVRMGHGTTH